MATRYILIKSTDSTQDLEDEATEIVNIKALKIPQANWSAALAELNSIGRTKSVYSTNLDEESGSVDGIVLPPEAF